MKGLRLVSRGVVEIMLSHKNVGSETLLTTASGNPHVSCTVCDSSSSSSIESKRLKRGTGLQQ